MRENTVRVYVVLEEDRGCGVSVAGVFSSVGAAQKYLNGPDGSNCYLYSEEGEVLLAEHSAAIGAIETEEIEEEG